MAVGATELSPGVRDTSSGLLKDRLQNDGKAVFWKMMYFLSCVHIAARLMKFPQTCGIITRNTCLVKALKSSVIIAVSNGRSGKCLICQAPLPYVYTQKAELRSYDSHWVVYKAYNVYYLALDRKGSPPRLHQHKIRLHLMQLW